MTSLKKPNKFDYNVIVIGAGSAGLVTSLIAATLKAKVALIEKNKMGGDCLNTGCVPSKALIRTAKMLSYAKRAKDFGLQEMNAKFDFAEVMERIQSVIKKIEPHDSVERYTSLGVECIQGEAEILSPWHIKVNNSTITCKAMVISTGASPIVPPIKGIEKITPLTSENLWDLRTQPKKMVVLGGGPIGCELAQSFQRLGTEVTLVEMNNRIMPREDEDVSEAVTEKLRSEGMNLLTNHKAIEIKTEGKNKTLITEQDGIKTEIEFDEILVAVGRRANTKGFGLENLNIELAPNGTILHNEFLATNHPNVYVCGDVAGPFQFTHTASHQAYYASVNALFAPFNKWLPGSLGKHAKVDYSVIPWATYTDPEVATVGLTETSAKEKNIAYEVTKYGIDDLDRAIADSEDHGFVKVLTKPGTDKIIGATVVGNHASDLIGEFIAAMKHGFGLNGIMGTIHIYPTMLEANKFAAGEWKKARKPEGLLEKLKKFHAWRRG